MTVDPQKAKAIFLEAVEHHEPDQWAEYLEQACGTDLELRKWVYELLRAHPGEDSLLDRVGVDVTVDQPVTEEPGVQIGPYKLLQRLGEGGMGAVYMAEQREPVKRRVALKIIKPGMDTGQVIARFEAERQALSLMDHPNIARVLDAGTTDSGRPYFVMELVKGQPITEYCDEHHLTTRQRLEMVLPVCQAIQHAHQKGIIHRDIKPSNILVAEYDHQPVPKVIDFGVAKATSQPLTEKTMFTGYGQIVGTLEYMSPEQAKVNQLDVDTRSDIYSIGVVLYELLIGEIPFDRARLRSAAFDEMLRILREEEPPKPSLRLSSSQALPSIAALRDTEPKRLCSLVRGELDWIIMRCLEKERSRRYETAGGLAEDLQRYLADEPVLAKPPTALYRLSKYARRHRSLVVSAASIAMALIIGCSVAVWKWVETNRALADSRMAESRADVAAQEAERARKISERHLYLAEMNRAWDAWRAGNLDVAQRLVDRYRPRDEQSGVPGVEWQLLAAELQIPERIHRLEIDSLPAHLSVAPDGRHFCVLQHNRKLAVYSADQGLVETLPCDVPVMFFGGVTAIAPSGDLLAYAGEAGRSLCLRQLGTTTEYRFPTDGAVTAVAFHPDATTKWLAVADSDASAPVLSATRVTLWQYDQKENRHTWTLTNTCVNELAWSSNGQWLGAACEDGKIVIWHAVDMNTCSSISVGFPLRDLTFLDDDTIVAAVGSSTSEHQIQLWDVAKGTLTATLPGHDGVIHAVERLPNGDLASCGRDNLIRIWDVRTRREKRRLRGHSHYVTSLAACGTAEKPLLVSAGCDYQVAVWSLAPTAQVREIRTQAPSQVHKLAMTADERSLISANWTNSVEVRNRSTGEMMQSVSSPSAAWGLAIDKDDRLAIGCIDGSVFLYGLQSGERVELPRQEFLARALAFSPRGDCLAIAGVSFDSATMSQVLSIWRTDSLERITSLYVPLGFVLSVAWSPNGKLLAASGDHGVRVWRSDTWEVAYDLHKHRVQVPDVAFSPDGSLLASCGWDCAIRFWDANTGAESGAPLCGHAGFIWGIAFSPDGKTLFSTSGDETVGVWDVESRELRARIPDHVGGSKSVCVSKSGTWLATGGLWDNKILLRRLQPTSAR